jgi:hypothetical protein
MWGRRSIRAIRARPFQICTAKSFKPMRHRDPWFFYYRCAV